jgi:hypothetical protein
VKRESERKKELKKKEHEARKNRYMKVKRKGAEWIRNEGKKELRKERSGKRKY